MALTSVKRAIISVSDKTGLVEFAQALAGLGVEIIASGGTSQVLQKATIPHRQIDEITGWPEMLDGRVKTLHPKVHGGILGKRDSHADEAHRHGIDWIDLVVVNFYPFAEGVRDAALTLDKAVELIDVGGPTMVRAAAKNCVWVGVVTDPHDYSIVTAELEQQGGLREETRLAFAAKAFALTSRYDAMIYAYLTQRLPSVADASSERLQLTLEKKVELRYGENPHQRASAYQFEQQDGLLSAKQHQGKPLSFNNILDAEAAISCVSEFDVPACVIIKHANPCGVATGATIEDAYERAYQSDPLSAFGGIIALNRPCSQAIADAMANIFMEVVVAPSYTSDALAVFARKPNLRILEMPAAAQAAWEMKFITGGVLMQEKDPQVMLASDLKQVTKRTPTTAEMDAMLFAWRVLKHIKSNGILIARDGTTVGIGAGQVSRVDAVDLAIRKAGERIQDTILASDAFFPFRDSIDHLANTGVRAIIQPGGSVRDEEVIAACDEHGIAMMFTGKRCFRH